MRHIFNLIASFVHRKTRSPGVLWLRRKLHQFSAMLYQHRKQIVAGVFVVTICGVYLGVSGTVFAAPTTSLPPELQKAGWWSNLNPVLWALRILNELLSILVGLAGKLASLLISILMNIAQYNDFLSSTAVANGWVVTRDIANMFFIIILLVIAFGTILGSGDYNTKMLGKLLVMAVVINFSRTIVGIMIDASQIIMLTFVNGFSAAGAGNFINAFGVNKVLQYQENYAGEANTTGLALIGASLLMGLVLMGVACWVLVTIVGTLLFRVAYIWFLIVISPIAWLMSTFPAGKKYYAQWWDQFRDQLVVGPAMAFFLWLSLTAVGSGLAWNQVIVKGEALANVDLGLTQILTSESILSFAITIVLLVASKEMAQKLAGSASGYGTFMKSYMNTLARGKKLGVGALKAADLVQASVGLGPQVSLLPERIKKGFENRKKLMQQKADDYRFVRAEQARRLGLGVGGVLSAAYAPDVTIEKFGQGGIRGIWSRRVENIKGTGFYRDSHTKWTEGNKGQQRDLEQKIEKERNTTGLKAAEESYDSLLEKQQNLMLTKELFVKASAVGDEEMDEDQFKLAKKLGMLGKYKDIGYGAYKKKSKEINAAILGKINNDFGGDVNRALVNSTAAVDAQETEVKNKKEAFHTATKDLQEQLLTLKKSQASHDRTFMAGDVGLGQRIDRQRFSASAEANKLIDPDATRDDLVVFFTRALAEKNTAMVDAVLKRLAKQGNTEAVYSTLGIRGTGGLQAMQQLVGELKSQGGFDDRTAMTLANRLGELESLAGSVDNANLSKIDKVTGIKTWRDPESSAAVTMMRTLAKPSEDTLKTLSAKTLWTTGPDGMEDFSPNAPAILEVIKENPKALRLRLERGDIEAGLLIKLRKYYQKLTRENIWTEDTIKELELTQLPKAPRKIYKSVEDAQEYIAKKYASTDMFGDLGKKP